MKKVKFTVLPQVLLTLVLTSSCMPRAATTGNAGEHYLQVEQEIAQDQTESLLLNLRDLGIGGDLRDPVSVGAALGVRLLPPSGNVPSRRGKQFQQYLPAEGGPYRERDIQYEVSHDPAGAGELPRLSASLGLEGLISRICIKHGDLMRVFGAFPRAWGTMPFADGFVLKQQGVWIDTLSFWKEPLPTSCVRSLGIVQIAFESNK